MEDTVNRKLDYVLEKTSKAREELLESQHNLIGSVNKKIVIPVSETEKAQNRPHSLEFIAEQWVEIKKVVSDIVSDIRNVAGYAKALAFPGTEITGADIIVSYLRVNSGLRTLAVAFDRRVHLIRGVLHITGGSDKVMESIKKRGSNRFFSGDTFYVEKHEYVIYDIIHNCILITKLITDETEMPPL